MTYITSAVPGTRHGTARSTACVSFSKHPESLKRPETFEEFVFWYFSSFSCRSPALGVGFLLLCRFGHQMECPRLQPALTPGKTTRGQTSKDTAPMRTQANEVRTLIHMVLSKEANIWPITNNRGFSVCKVLSRRPYVSLAANYGHCSWGRSGAAAANDCQPGEIRYCNGWQLVRSIADRVNANKKCTGTGAHRRNE